jgi:hypothetical protein
MFLLHKSERVKFYEFGPFKISFSFLKKLPHVGAPILSKRSSLLRRGPIGTSQNRDAPDRPLFGDVRKHEPVADPKGRKKRAVGSDSGRHGATLIL